MQRDVRRSMGLLVAAGLTAGLAGPMGVGCAAERQPLTAVPQRYSYVQQGVRLPEPAPRVSAADRYLDATADRPARSLRTSAEAARSE
jgi:hypothetical protein